MTIAKTLLMTTALVLCVSTAFAAQKIDRPKDKFLSRFMKLGVPEHIVQGFPVTVMIPRRGTLPVPGNSFAKYRNAIFDNIRWRDKNAEWISWYGFNAINLSECEYVSSNYHYCDSEDGFNAFPFYGTGKKAKKIGVAIFGGSEYNIGIYSATVSGLPGSEIAGASATANNFGTWPVTWVDVDVELKAGQEYFLAFSCPPGSTFCEGGWYMEDSNFLTAVDYWHVKEKYSTVYYSTVYKTTISSPWHESNLYPVEGAAVIK